jgi:hypothetical protein
MGNREDHMIGQTLNVSEQESRIPCMISGNAEFAQGMKVYWHFQGGKNTLKIPAVVLKVMRTRVRIEFMTWEAGRWVQQTRTIAPSNLTVREDATAPIDGSVHPVVFYPFH